MSSLAVGTPITTEEPVGVVRVLARVVSPGFAACAVERCPVHIQRTLHGDLADGVRAHYKAAHPERKI
jgi:hypothetical protein